MDTLSGIVLAAGNGTRFLPLTHHTPKPLLSIAGKPAITYNMDAMLPHVNEFIIVTGYLKETFPRTLGTSYKGVPIKYVHQKKQQGTADAFACTKDHIKNDSFLLIYGDDIYDPAFFRSIAHTYNAAVGQYEKNWHNYGVFQVSKNRKVEKLVEKPSEFIGYVVNVGVFHLHKDIFHYVDDVPQSVRGEYELTDLINLYVKDHPVDLVQFEHGWRPLSYPWHILDQTEFILSKSNSDIRGIVEPGATIHGTVILEKGAVIKSGAYLEGNFYIGTGSIIGPNCSLRKFAAIGSGSVIGNGTEVSASVLGTNVMAKHLVYVGDSIIGNNVNLAAGTITANLRHDGMNVSVMINGKRTDSGRKKFGAIIGDNVKTGIHTTIFPGRKIDRGVWTMPSEIIKSDKIQASV